MEEYKSNSFKSKEVDEKKEIKPVTTGKVKKKSEVRKFFDIFMADEKEDVKSYIVLDVLIPSVKKAVWDIIAGGLEMILFGGKRDSKSTASKVSYSSYYKDKNRSRDDGPKSHIGYDFSDIILDTRGEAEEILMRMDELVSVYGVVSVADFYDLANISGSYTDNKYGWTDIRNASIIRSRDGYIIKLPKALPINSI